VSQRLKVQCSPYPSSEQSSTCFYCRHFLLLDHINTVRWYPLDVPFEILAGLWGATFLEQSQGFSKEGAAHVCSLLVLASAGAMTTAGWSMQWYVLLYSLCSVLSMLCALCSVLSMLCSLCSVLSMLCSLCSVLSMLCSLCSVLSMLSMLCALYALCSLCSVLSVLCALYALCSLCCALYAVLSMLSMLCALYALCSLCSLYTLTLYTLTLYQHYTCRTLLTSFLS
jgi:hypothetical protein